MEADEEPGPQTWPTHDLAALEEELSDILIYLVALVARCRMDLPHAVLSKIGTNRRRYPVHLSHGNIQIWAKRPPLKTRPWSSNTGWERSTLSLAMELKLLDLSSQNLALRSAVHKLSSRWLLGVLSPNKSTG